MEEQNKIRVPFYSCLLPRLKFMIVCPIWIDIIKQETIKFIGKRKFYG